MARKELWLKLKSEIETRASFDKIRYAQVWEDADVLIEALDIQPTDTVLSIASGGDNAFALLAQNPQKVYAVDLSDAQIEICNRRKDMYKNLSWEEHIRVLQDEILPHGKFENYLRGFSKKVLPLIHSKKNIEKLLEPKSLEERVKFYNEVWDNRRWRLMFKLFFSRFIMGRLGRDKEFFKFVEGSVADRILSRTKHALTALDTSQNPYLHYILQGKYTNALPYSLRPENYEKIRNNLNKIEFRKQSIELFIATHDGIVNAFNLSDIFEYMSQEGMDELYNNMLSKAVIGTRFAYWNMLAPRKANNPRIVTNETNNKKFLLKDKAFFYSAFYLDEVVK